MATFGIYTLGCKVNQYESEAIAELLEKKGLKEADCRQSCDIYIINTCTVTSESDRKCRQIIRRAISENPQAYILVCGCMAQVDSDSIKNINGVDYICGNADKTKIADAAVALLEKGKRESSAIVEVTDIATAPFLPMCITKFERTRAYIKIQDGCESNCTYCIIPKARGVIRSKAVEDVLNEVKLLTEGGCKEIVLTGIETGSYGKDIGSSLAELLEKIDLIEGIGRVRLGSLDPSIMNPKFIKRLGKLNSLAHHFHISMQSGSSEILAKMKRKYNADMALKAINELKLEMPDVCITTDIIVGFPQETEENFRETIEFAKKAEFLMMHVFPYSKRNGTPAAQMSGQLDMKIKKKRVSELSAVGAQLRKKILDNFVESQKEVSVLFEDYKSGYAYGHTDNFIEVKASSPRSLHSETYTVHPIKTDGNVVLAEIINIEELK